MRKSTPQTLDTIFDSASSLQQIQERTVALAKLNNMVNQLLPTPLQQHCRIANYRQHILIIEVSSASWLTRLRYEQEKLLSSLRQAAIPALSSIQYSINPDLSVYLYQLKSETVPRTLSVQSADLLRSLAQDSSPKLKERLIQLANHATKSDNSV